VQEPKIEPNFVLPHLKQNKSQILPYDKNHGFKRSKPIALQYKPTTKK